MSEAVLRELGAKARTFKTIAVAILWYAEQYSRRTGIQVKLEHGVVPLSREQRESDNYTYASIVACLTERASEDYSFDPPITGERLSMLVAYYISDGAAADWKQRNEAHYGMSWNRFVREARKTRNVIRRRMEARGLIGGDDVRSAL